MKPVPWGLLVLLAACGGGTSERPGMEGAPAIVEPAKAPGTDSTLAPAGDEQPAATAESGTECSVLREQTLQILNHAVETAPRDCAVDEDCILYSRRPDCAFDCGLVAAVTASELIDAAIDRVDSDLCPERCLQVPSSCGGGPGPFDQPRAACQANKCAVGTHLTVIRETFEATLYPLLRSHCQSCHSSESEAQEPLFADSDVTVALDHSLMFDWEGEGQDWRIVDPQASPFVQLLSAQEHHCWSECSADANEMLVAIRTWSDAQAERP
jgi:hypothetical protein